MTERNKVEAKSSPNVKAEADNETFAKDYLVKLDNSKTIPQEIVDRQIQDVKASALQRGLKPVGEVTLESKKAVDDQNVVLVYSVPVVPNTN